jgi:hypothetical protein|eukprot:COSAG01_NODE_3291_length_6306_cov_2.411632_2_plen_216_part_00
MVFVAVDYGNSENNQLVPWRGGAGSMEAIYFGNANWHGNRGVGKGPWAGADLEAGMYYGGGAQTIVNNRSKPLTSDFVSLHVKGRTDGFAIKGGDATTGEMATMYDGPRPDPKLSCCDKPPWHYQPMLKQGAIILGTGGDNSNGAEGRRDHPSCLYARLADQSLLYRSDLTHFWSARRKFLRRLHCHRRDIRRDRQRHPNQHHCSWLQDAANLAA